MYKRQVQPLDVSDRAAVGEAVARWDRDTGGLDLVLANAGLGRACPAHKLEPDEALELLEVNVIGACATLLAAVGPMVARGRGTLVGMSSLAGMRGLPAAGTYSASKAALSAFLETLRIDLARKGLSVVDIRPGFVKTAMTADNAFPMPFLMELDEAADRCLAGIDRGKAVVAFPWPMYAAMVLARGMPGALWRWLASRQSPGRRPARTS